MSLKQKLLDVVKSGYAQFDAEQDNFEVEFEGGGDSFGSFYSLTLYRHDDYSFNFEGDLDLNEHQELLFEILDAADVGYNWNDAGTTGRINYNEDGDGELRVTTTVSTEYFGEVED